MALIQQTMNGSLAALPSDLPDSVYMQAGATKPGSVPALPAMTGVSRGMSPMPSSPLRTHITGQSRVAAAASPIYPQTTSSMTPKSRSGTLGQSQRPWAITPLEKSQSDTFFGMLDTARSGYISGDVAGPFFLQSGLSGDILASVWDLSDIKNEGRLDKEEFALARRLIMDALTGKQIPDQLEESFVPPSMREVWKGTNQQHQPRESRCPFL